MTITLSGLGGSGLDWQSIVQQLQQAEVAQKITPLTNQKQNDSDRLTAWQGLGGQLAAVKTAADALSNPTDFQVYTPTLSSSNSSVTPSSILTATVGTGASKGNYDIIVNKLAQGERMGSGQTFSDTFTFGSNAGTLSIGTTSANSANVNLAGQTLSQVRDSINALDSGSNPTGVTASILQVTGGTSPQYQLLLSADQTGTANGSILESVTGGPAPGDPSYLSFTASQNAQNAELYLNGDKTTTITRPTNSISDLIPGLTLDLNNADPNTTINVSVGTDTQSIEQKVTAFVNAYNSVIGTIEKQNTYNQNSKTTGGPLYGDPTMRTIQDSLDNSVLDSRSPLGSALSSAGITFNDNNTLSFDATKFESALQANPSDTTSLFNSFAGSVSTTMDGYTNSYDGTLTTMEKNIQNSMDNIDKKTADVQSRIDTEMASLTNQFINMDSAIGAMQSQSSYVSASLK